MVEGKRRIVVDVFEVTHYEDLGDNNINYTKKKWGTQVYDFDADTNIGEVRAKVAQNIINITKEIS